jgi:thiamine kinase-like enzyme
MVHSHSSNCADLFEGSLLPCVVVTLILGLILSVSNAPVELAATCMNAATFGLAHGDCRIENFYFFDNGGDEDVGMIDFQLLCKGDVMQDLAWFFIGSTTPEVHSKLKVSFALMQNRDFEVELELDLEFAF